MKSPLMFGWTPEVLLTGEVATILIAHAAAWKWWGMIGIIPVFGCILVLIVLQEWRLQQIAPRRTPDCALIMSGNLAAAFFGLSRALPSMLWIGVALAAVAVAAYIRYNSSHAARIIPLRPRRIVRDRPSSIQDQGGR